MLKKFAVSLLTLAFLSLGAGSAFGATAAAPDPAKLAELKALHQQMVELKVQMLDKQVEAGILEKEKAAEIKAKIEHHQKKVEEDLANGKYDFGKRHHKDGVKKSEGDQKTSDTKSSSSTR
ncbi:Protein of unknown function (DUF2680) [Desulfitobacterium dichloroeliminans LMG P-21439]|uniref:DUF2680 domain-containing protein n=1 Tax=Desulfitobacterium dichloroeliminans (strain LMG P-21439 / DCA1) TaxID=871963 RepID=L0FCR5_DESDL|nr:DUF2680 domain-containing protein [Desulfitobacterium dichloroeliminans]AGA70800.1 Protein of unknown function (DUF2680) [Desulfitobacterium dichloroeliminans LMG P-21439]